MSVIHLKSRSPKSPRNISNTSREDSVADALESVKLSLYRLRDAGERSQAKNGSSDILDMVDSFTLQGYEAVVKMSRRLHGY